MVWSITFWSLPNFKKLIQFLRLLSNLTQISFPYLSRAAVWSGKILSSHATSKHNSSSGLGEGARRENNVNIPSLNCPGLQSSVSLCWFSSEHLLVTDGLLTGGHPNAVFPQGHICGFFWGTALFSLSWRVPAWILPYLSNSGSPRCSPQFSQTPTSVYLIPANSYPSWVKQQKADDQQTPPALLSLSGRTNMPMTKYNGVRTHCAPLKDVSGLWLSSFPFSCLLLIWTCGRWWAGEKENTDYIRINSALDDWGFLWPPVLSTLFRMWYTSSLCLYL